MTQVVVIRSRTIPRNRTYITAGVALLMLALAGINLGIGYNGECDYYYDSSGSYCHYRNNALIISGYCFLVSGVLFLISAITLEVQIRKALRNPPTTVQQPVTIPSGYPTQVVTTFPTVSTQHPPPYSPPTGITSYPMSPYANQAPPTAGFAAPSGPTQQYSKDIAQPPPYAP